jgi:hypothetical protein
MLAFSVVIVLTFTIIHVLAKKDAPLAEPKDAGIMMMNSTAPSISPTPSKQAKSIRPEAMNLFKKSLKDAKIAPKMVASSVAPTVSPAPSRNLGRYAAKIATEQLHIFPQPPTTEKPSVSLSPSKETETVHGIKTAKNVPAGIVSKTAASSVAPTVSPAPSRSLGRYASLHIFPQPPTTGKPSVSLSPSKETEIGHGIKKMKSAPLASSAISKSDRGAQEDVNIAGSSVVIPALLSEKAEDIENEWRTLSYYNYPSQSIQRKM